MDVLVALMPRLGVDAAACVALARNHVRRAAVVRVQCATRRWLARRKLIRRVVTELTRLLEANKHTAPAVSKALPTLREMPIARQMVVIRVIVVGGGG